MTLRWSIAAFALLAAGSVFAQNKASAPAQGAAPAAAQQAPPAPITPADKPNLSYAIGFQMGDGLVERKIDVDVNAVIRGIQDGFAKRKPTVAEETMRDVLGRMQAQMYTAAKAEFEKLASDNKAKSQKFLAGDLPGYPDYILLSPFLWAYSVSPIKLLAEDDPVHAWRERMLDLFDGMGRKAKGA